VNNAAHRELSSALFIDEAFELMERAQVLLDRAGLAVAAARLDHVLAVIPDGSGVVPRKRTNPPVMP
jgi:hypothetical protein